jgi:predicted ATP-binding protein involved in virulence
MLLRRLQLDNVKCFAAGTEIDFTVGKGKNEPPHRWVVVYGDNGLGKSTLLRSIAVALAGQPGINFLLPSAEGWVRGNSRTARIEVEFSRHEGKRGDSDVITGQRKRPITVSTAIVGRSATTVEGQRFQAGSIVLERNQDASLFQNHIATDEPGRGWLLCGYGPHRRLTGASSDLTEKQPPPRAARLMTLFHEKAALTSAEQWLIQADHEAQRDPDARRRLDAIRAMLDGGLLHGDVAIRDIQPKQVLFRTPFSNSVQMSDLSDGYRTSLALALDLLQHVSFCFDPEKVVRRENGRAYVAAEGVVLIDEIDSHLHPSWQRTIGPWLHQTFPSLQFIVATHSPLIPERISKTDGMAVRLKRRTQGKGEVVDADCVRTTDQSLTADQNLTGPNFGLKSTRDVVLEDLLAEIHRLRSDFRRGRAKPADERKLRQLELEFEETAPPTGGVERMPPVQPERVAR